MLTCASENSKLYFTPELVPFSSHAIIHRHGAFHESLLRHLYQYLHFTAVLEHGFVNRITQDIASLAYPIEIPQEAQLDAFRIYCDEAYHALASMDIIFQLKKQSGIDYIPFTPSYFVKLKRRERSSERKFRYLVGLLFVIVSETLISSVLIDVHKDSRICDGVRLIIKDHAADEAIHHAYFSQFFKFLWPRLSSSERQFAAPLFADFIEGFLSPDLKQVKSLLSQMGLSNQDVRKVLDDHYSTEGLSKDSQQAASATLRLLRSVGVFDIQQACDAFAAKGIAI